MSVCGSPVMPRSGVTGTARPTFQLLYRELVPGRRAGWFGTGASECERNAGTLEPAVPGGVVLHPCAASIHRGDRRLQGASEANGRPGGFDGIVRIE